MSYQVSEKTRDAFDKALRIPQVKDGVNFIFDDHENTIKEQLELVVIKAPTFQEQARAQEVARRFEALGLSDVHVDGIGNAIGILKGADKGPAIVIEAHMDTVYPMDQPINPVIGDDGFIRCPSIADNTSGVAALMTIIRAFRKADITLNGDVYFVGTVREEGMGGLGGIDYFMKEHTDISAYICIDGVQADKLFYQYTGNTTCMVTFHGAGGGHACSSFGEMANPLHAAGRAVGKIADIQVPEEPRTTYCVSNFHAGNDSGIHAIVAEAVIKINMRSSATDALEKLKREVYRAIDDACKEETARWGKDEITYTIHEYCNIPACSQDKNTAILEAAYLAGEYLGKTPVWVSGGLNDAGRAISAGIPAVCIGQGTVNTYSHSADKERFPIKDTEKGPQAAFLVAILCSGIPGKIDSIL